MVVNRFGAWLVARPMVHGFLAWLVAKPIRFGLLLTMILYLTGAAGRAVSGHWSGWGAPLPFAVGFSAVWIALRHFKPRLPGMP